MKKCACILSLIFCCSIYAQEQTFDFSKDSINSIIENNHNRLLMPDDSLRIPIDELHKSAGQVMRDADRTIPEVNKELLKEKIYYPYFHTSNDPIYFGNYNVSGSMINFEHGAIVGAGSYSTLPGLGNLGKATAGYYHVFNERLSGGVYLDISKFKSYYYSNTYIGTSGNLTYRLADRVSLTGYGSYAKDVNGNSFGNYGGYASFDVTERFGVNFGAQQFYNSFDNKSFTVPIVAPYYRINKNVKLEFDVGPVMQNAIRNLVK